jgi:hypothetical protein
VIGSLHVERVAPRQWVWRRYSQSGERVDYAATSFATAGRARRDAIRRNGRSLPIYVDPPDPSGARHRLAF